MSSLLTWLGWTPKRISSGLLSARYFTLSLARLAPVYPEKEKERKRTKAEYTKEWIKGKHNNDKEWTKALSEKQNNRRKEAIQNSYASSEAFLLALEKNRGYDRSRKNNPVTFAKTREKQKAYGVARYHNDPEYRQRVLLTRWVLFRRQTLESPDSEFTWRNHIPIFSDDKVVRLCQTCQKMRYVRIWWERKAEPDKYDCNGCFRLDMSRALPIGCEDHVFGKGIKMKPKR